MQKQTVKPDKFTQLSLFPVMDNCEEAYKYIQASLPIEDSNQLHALLMMYQNTLLQGWNKYKEKRKLG